jgi:hypothetical protein
MLPRESLWRVFVASFRCERELSPMKQAVTNEALFSVDADVFDGICIMVHNSRVNKSSDIHHGRYEWDARKASINAKEHGVTFVEVASALLRRDDGVQMPTSMRAERDDICVAGSFLRK